VSTLARLRAVIATVPRGKVVTYGQVAAAGGFPRAPRLTVWALQGGKGLPWHRVVGAGGRIALPGAEGQEQRLRLRMEGVTFRGDKVRMDRHNWVPRPRSRARPGPVLLKSRRGAKEPLTARGRRTLGARRPLRGAPRARGSTGRSSHDHLHRMSMREPAEGAVEPEFPVLEN
jgi:methylated-DNA-protein-cysteine methyltransferase related protein